MTVSAPAGGRAACPDEPPCEASHQAIRRAASCGRLRPGLGSGGGVERLEPGETRLDFSRWQRAFGQMFPTGALPAVRQGVDAAGILAEGIPAARIGASPRSAAEIAVVTDAAVTGEVSGADRPQQRMVAIDRDEALVADIAEPKGEKSRGIDIAVVGDKRHPLAVARCHRGSAE